MAKTVLRGEAPGAHAPVTVLPAIEEGPERAILAATHHLVIEVEAWDRILEGVELHRPALVVLALPLSVEHQAALIRAIVAQHPATPILVVAHAEDERRLVATLKAGASGYLQRRRRDATRSRRGGGPRRGRPDVAGGCADRPPASPSGELADGSRRLWSLPVRPPRSRAASWRS